MHELFHMPSFQTQFVLRDILESTVTPPPKGKGYHQFGHHKTQTIASGRKQVHPRITRLPLTNLYYIVCCWQNHIKLLKGDNDNIIQRGGRTTGSRRAVRTTPTKWNPDGYSKQSKIYLREDLTPQDRYIKCLFKVNWINSRQDQTEG